MASDPASDRRRSTRVRLKVAIEAKGIAEPLNCEGETEVVNLHGAFISTAFALRVGMTVDVRVVLTGNVRGPRWSTSIVSSLDSVVSLWISHRTFGGFCYRQTTGRRMNWRVFPSSTSSPAQRWVSGWIVVKKGWGDSPYQPVHLLGRHVPNPHKYRVRRNLEISRNALK